MTQTGQGRTTHASGPVAEVVERFAGIVGRAHVTTAPDERRFFSSDVYRSGVTAAAVVSPGTKTELAAVLAAATGAGIAVMPRGGGLSYADGYLPDRPDSIVLDVRRLNRVIEVNPEDMYVTVEAGCTWHTLYEALKAQNLRAPFFGPFSGRYATVGGALAQNSMFHGCTLHGSSVESVLGLEVALADGSLLRTGSGATPFQPSPFFRTFGPDLTGLFLADAGAMGVKTEVTLRVIRFPAVTLCASFGYGSYEPLCRAMAAIARENLASECFAFDPRTQAFRIRRMELVQGLKSVAGVVAAQGSLMAGLRKGAEIALAGRRFLDDVAYSMHIVVEGRSPADAEGRLDAIREIALKEGREVANTIPTVMTSVPFPEPTGMLGPDGERWIPVLGLVPHSRAIDLVTAIHRYMDENAGLMAQNQVAWSYLMQICGTTGFFIEPELFWKDVRPIFHERYLDKAYVARLTEYPDNPGGRAAVETLRKGLVALYLERGAAHSHIGKMYPYRQGRLPVTFDLLQHIKKKVDPYGLINPGALGLP